MPLQPIAEEDLGRGIDQFHPEHRIPPGFIENARNFDPTAEGTLRKRVGYQLFGGYVPIRVASVSRTANIMSIVLSVPGFSLATLRSTQLVIAGRTATGTGGPFGGSAIVSLSFSSFTTDGNRTLLVGSVGGNFASAPFEGSLWGISPALLDATSDPDVDENTAFDVDHLDYFRNSTTQHPVCAFLGGFYAATSGEDASRLRPSGLSSRLTVGITTVSSEAIISVDTGLDTLTVGGATALVTGNAIRFTTSGTLPSPLLTGTDYFAIKTAVDTIRVATTYANAIAGIFVNLTTVGAGARTILASVVIAPLFVATGEPSPRTRGRIASTDALSGWVHGSSIVYNPSTGYVEFGLSLPAMDWRTVSDTTETLLSNLVTAGQDFINIRDASYSSLNGRHRIAAIAAGVNALTVSVQISGIEDVDAATLPDVASAGFYAGIFSDRLQYANGSIPLRGARLTNGGIPDTENLSILSLARSTFHMYVGDVADVVILPRSSSGGNPPVDQTITAHTLPMLQADTAYAWVRGDGLWFSGLPATQRVRVANTSSDVAATSVSVTADGSSAQVSGMSTTGLSVGDWVFLSEVSGSFTAHDGEHQISEIVDGTTFAFDTEETESGGTYDLLGRILGLSEPVELSSTYDGTYAAPERWVPIEAVPRANTAVPNQTFEVYYTRYNPTTGANNIKFRSTMVSESMYLTDYENIVYKYDGQYLSSAGLPRWQPLLGLGPMANRFNRVLNADRARDVNEAAPVTDGVFHLTTPGDAADFNSQDRVTYSARTTTGVLEQDFSVLSVDTAANEAAGTAAKVRMAPPVMQTSVHTPASDLLIRSLTRRYYYTLYRRDTNYRVQVSQPASIEDAVVRFGGAPAGTGSTAGIPGARIDALLAKPPLYRMFDYRQVELQSSISIGRDGTPVFAVGAILPLDYSSTTQSALATIQDSATVESLALRGRDNTAKTVLDQLFFTELGKPPALAPVLDRPPRGKALSTAANRLLIGNLRSPARATIAGFVPDDRPIDPVNILNRIKVRKDSTTYTFFTFQAGDGTYTRSNCVVAGTDASNGLYVRLSSAAPVAVIAGMWVQLAGYTQSYQLSQYSMDILGWYQVIDPAPVGYAANTIKVRAPVRAPIQVSVTSLAANEFTSATAHQLNIGDPVILRNALGVTGSLPSQTGPAVMSGQYYAIPVSSTIFRLATTYANAVAGTAVDVIAIEAAPTFAHFVEALPGGTGLHLGFPDTSTTTTIPVMIWNLNSIVLPESVVGDSRLRMLDNKEVTKHAVISVMMKDLGRAINAVAAGLSVAGTAPFVYCTALGNDAAVPNSIELEALDPADDFDVAVDFPSNSLPEWYINNVRATDNSFVAAPQAVFPSRIARSYPNFPEVFGNPFLLDARLSDSAIDVGDDDGDEVVTIIPRFGESFSNAANTQGAVLVFKTRAVYLVDVNTKQVAQLETNGQGCTFPRSVIRTKNGILFANEAGLWKINESNQCTFLGQILKRYWEQGVNRDANAVSDIICGHHDARRNHAMVSVPVIGETATDDVVSYDHTRENADDRGAWAIYNNFHATGWCNAGSDTLFGTNDGSVFALRRANDETDYQDDADPVGGYDIDDAARGAYAILAEKGFSMAGFRKRVTYVQVGFRSDNGSSVDVTDPIEVSSSVDHRHTFDSLDSFKLVDPAAGTGDNLSGTNRGNITTLQFSLPIPKAEYVQLRFFDDTTRRPVEITDVTYLVDVLQTGGVPSAGATRE